MLYINRCQSGQVEEVDALKQVKDELEMAYADRASMRKEITEGAATGGTAELFRPLLLSFLELFLP